MRAVLLPGWNEKADLMRTLSDGRNGIDGLAAFGIDCTVFNFPNDDTLPDLVDRFANFLDVLKTREPDAFPIATIGYSAGGLVNRAFLRKFPERAGEIAATIQVAAPNGGLSTNYALGTLRLAHMPVHMLRDLDEASDFVTWLNATSGEWVVDPDNPKKKRWRLSAPPWVAPPGHRLLHIVGRMPKYGLQSDGVVMIESATLDGAMPIVSIDDDGANHLNLGAVANMFATVFRRFAHDDNIWPRVVELCARFLRSESVS